MEQILTSYIKRLTNLSGNNRSLLLKQLSADHFIDLHDFDFIDNQPSFQLIADLIKDEGKIKLCDGVDSRDPIGNQLAKKLNKIHRNEKFIFEERGSKDMYVGWPFVRGKFNDDSPVNAPLIFFPISILFSGGVWYMQRRKDVNVTFNKTFILAYAYFNQLPPDEELLETVLTDFDTESTAYRTQIYQTLKNSKTELNFNQELFLDKLLPFSSKNKKEIEKTEKTGQLKLYSNAILGIFPQSGSYLLPDYLHLIKENEHATLDDFFVSKTSPPQAKNKFIKLSERVLEENTFTPLELDAYQEEAIKSVKQGKSIVIKGPPGTGKSQCIANLICDYIARGKSVLLISQKKAALDVVHKRLKEQELHDFVGQVHDFKNDRQYVFEKIARQIARLQEYQQKNNGLDTIFLERKFTQACRAIEQISEELNEYRQALFDESECGKSVKELYLTQKTDDPTIHLSQHYQMFQYAQLDVWIQKLRNYFIYKESFDHKSHFWASEKSFANYTTADLFAIKQTLDEIVVDFQKFNNEAASILHAQPDFDSIDFFLQKQELLVQFIQNLDSSEAFPFFRHLLENIPDEEPGWLIEMERILMANFKGAGPELSLKSNELGRFQESLQHAMKARRGLFSWLRWSLFSKDRIFITRVLIANDLKSNKEGFNILVERIDNRLNYEHIVREIESKNWLKNFPLNFRKIDLQNWFFYQRVAYKAFNQLKELRTIDAYVNFKTDNRKELITDLKNFSALIDQMPSLKIKWSIHLSDIQIREILSNRADIQNIKKELDRDFENLCAYHKIQDSFSLSEKELINLLDERETSTENKIICFKNSLALAWINHIEMKYPVLRLISTMEFEQKINILREAVEEKRSVSKDIALLKCREKTYEGLNYNRQNNLVSYRDLEHQVTKKRKVWPLRKVVASFEEEVFQLIPCWMTSPESASAIFPMAPLFDLVIFDEASQCFVERGIPAMYRGKQVVIAGDEKQLQPFDLYRVRWEDENDDAIPELEIISVLDLARRFLPVTMLQAHYRSQSMELIDFSNQHFYDQKLELLPNKATLAKNKVQSIYYHLTANGIWDENMNEAEAEKVIELVKGLIKKKQSIGIVTFNVPQQQLIIELLDKHVAIWDQLNIFVKNIENVQGDESDVIIFSLAYAVDQKGKLQFNFGLLSQQGGENRLNVAVTRARQTIHLVTSLTPDQFSKMDAKNEGPKLLKSYLDYAWKVSHQEWRPTQMLASGKSPLWYLRKKINVPSGMESNFSVREILPFSDLTVLNEDEMAGLIITDDDLYFRSLSPKQFYVYQFEHFNQKEWPHFQIHSRIYWQQQSVIEERLRMFLNRISTG